MTLLEIHGVHKRFGGVHALKGVDLTLRGGEVHALLGENGAGKSTLIKILSGMVRADEGECLMDGVRSRIDAIETAHALGIQTVHQELELALPLTVAENIFMGQLPTRRRLVDSRSLQRQARQALKGIGSDLDPRALVANLSVSDRQVVEIARALVRRASVLILDEPTAALPPAEVEKLLAIVRNLRAQGVGILYVTHRLDEVMRIADRATVLRDGRTVAQLDRSELERSTLVRHILGRELNEFVRDPSGPLGSVHVQCAGLHSGGELTNLGFEVRQGEIVGFFGLLGAGQSAIGDALFGLRKAECEAFRAGGLDGLPAHPRAALARGMGYVPADRKVAGLALSLSIGENLLLANMASVSRAGIVDRARLSETAQRAIRDYDIRCAGHGQRVDELSGGNQQKIALAKWAVRPTKVLFLDEPTRGVDVGAKVQIYRILQNFVARGGSCMVASSDAAEVVAIANRVIVLKAGRKAAELRGAEISEAALIAAAL